MIRNVSVPFGITTPEQPNIFWVDLNQIDFSRETGQVKTLDLGPNQTNTFNGMVNESFQEAKPFPFLGL